MGANNVLVCGLPAYSCQDSAQWYMAPEVMDRHVQTTKVGIYSLGATAIESLIGFQAPATPSTRSSVHHRTFRGAIPH